jgi:hypothetical protein
MTIGTQPNRRKLTSIIVAKGEPKPGVGYLIWDTLQRGLVLRVRTRKDVVGDLPRRVGIASAMLTLSASRTRACSLPR